MPKNTGLVAMMLMDHERSRQIGRSMEESAREYLSSGDPANLISHMKWYVEHITEHLWKENNRLFMMAEARLQHVSEKVDRKLHEIEDSRPGGLGKSREHYEQLAENLAKDVAANQD